MMIQEPTYDTNGVMQAVRPMSILIGTVTLSGKPRMTKNMWHMHAITPDPRKYDDDIDAMSDWIEDNGGRIYRIETDYVLNKKTYVRFIYVVEDPEITRMKVIQAHTRRRRN